MEEISHQYIIKANVIHYITLAILNKVDYKYRAMFNHTALVITIRDITKDYVDII